MDRVAFYPYFYVKDLFGFLIFLLLFSIILFFYPDMLGHPDNYIRANALVTPAHIVPEWYFLPFYAILRSIPNKLGGVACMGLALVIFFVVPFIHTPTIKNPRFKPLYRLGY
jgi:quinol-cytochrome oxidoreductase complex cytochrome b subunit